MRAMKLRAALAAGQARAERFLEAFPWKSTLIQAPQALQTLTGYGLTLGAGMGLVSDAFWAPLRALAGDRVTIVGPPPNDLLGKAARHMGAPKIHYTVGQALSVEDHFLLMAADAIAIAVLASAGGPAVLDRDGSLWLDTYPPIMEPWNPETLEVLIENQPSPGELRNNTHAALPAFATWRQILIADHQVFPQWIATFSREAPASYFSLAMFNAVAQGGELFFDWLTETDGSLEPIFEPEEQLFAHMFHYQVFPPSPVAAADMHQLLQRLAIVAAATGTTIPPPAEYIRVLRELFGSHTSDPPLLL